MCVLAGVGWGGAAPRNSLRSSSCWQAALRPLSPQLFTWRKAHLTLVAFEVSEAQKRWAKSPWSCLQ